MSDVTHVVKRNSPYFRAVLVLLTQPHTLYWRTRVMILPLPRQPYPLVAHDIKQLTIATMKMVTITYLTNFSITD